MSGRRQERLSEQLREEISLIMDGDLEDPRIGLATITEARVTPDLSHAKIFVSVAGTDEEAKETLAALNHAAGFIRHQLGFAIRMKRIPEIHFVHDDTLRTAARIEQILQEEEEKMKARELAETAANSELTDSPMQGSN
ncbi:MAG: 30S ribosome-binding factor RbfA [Acidobacteriota bacterium]